MPLLGGVWETNVAHSRILDTPPPDLHNAHTVHQSVKAHLSREVDKKCKEKRSPPNQTVGGPTLPTLPHTTNIRNAHLNDRHHPGPPTQSCRCHHWIIHWYENYNEIRSPSPLIIYALYFKVIPE